MSDSETTRPSATTGSPPAGARSRSGSRAMVVEDKTGLAAVVGSYLERDGFDVTLVHDGADAVITARKVDTLIGLSVGADEYVTKPFSPRELIARVGRDVWLAGEPVALTRTEFDLLAALSERLRTASAGASSSTMPGEAWVGDEHLVDVGSGRC